MKTKHCQKKKKKKKLNKKRLHTQTQKQLRSDIKKTMSVNRKGKWGYLFSLISDAGFSSFTKQMVDCISL